MHTIKRSKLWKNTIERFSFRNLALKGCSVIAFYHHRQLNVNRLASGLTSHLPLPMTPGLHSITPNLQQVCPADKGGGEAPHVHLLAASHLATSLFRVSSRRRH